MKGAIFYAGQYGSTAQYADWIAEATGLPVFDVHDSYADPTQYDFLILGSSVVIFKLLIRDWIKKHLPNLLDKPVILVTVSGAPPGPQLDGWIAACLPASFVAHMDHMALRGRMDPKTVSLWHRAILLIGAMKNKDPVARQEELDGFDYMDKSGIFPIVDQVRQLQNRDTNV